jgi:uncharacterized protein YbaP (TraB family)
MIRRLARALRPLALTALLLAAPLSAGAASAEPALWKVKGSGATIYLFGTVHVLKPDTAWRSAKIDAALKSADVLWLEVTNADDPAAMQPLIQKYGLDPAHPLSTKLDAASKAKLTRFVAGLGMAEPQFEPMRPWLVGLSVDVLPLMKAGYDPKSGVEEILKREEETAGKPIKGFETAEEQIRYLAEVSPQMELDFLKSSLDDAGKAVDDIDDMVAAWAAGDEKALEVLMNKDMQSDYPDIYDRLLVQRNRRFAAKIADLAKETGVVFVAVGAAHLLGPDSVQADLKKLGLIAERQ